MRKLLQLCVKTDQVSKWLKMKSGTLSHKQHWWLHNAYGLSHRKPKKLPGDCGKVTKESILILELQTTSDIVQPLLSANLSQFRKPAWSTQQFQCSSSLKKYNKIRTFRCPLAFQGHFNVTTNRQSTNMSRRAKIVCQSFLLSSYAFFTKNVAKWTIARS